MSPITGRYVCWHRYAVIHNEQLICTVIILLHIQPPNYTTQQQYYCCRQCSTISPVPSQSNCCPSVIEVSYCFAIILQSPNTFPTKKLILGSESAVADPDADPDAYETAAADPDVRSSISAAAKEASSSDVAEKLYV